MKRRSFLKRSSLGLTALAAGAGIPGLAGSAMAAGRVYGIPDSVRPRPALEHNLLRLSLARTDIPAEAWQDVAALSLLAQDVFDNPEVARTFTRDPSGYLKTIGLGDVTLDPESIEVKVALALGDPEIHAAITGEDPRAFVLALENRGLLRTPEPSVLAQRLGAQLQSMRQTLGDEPSPEACSTLAICVAAVWVWVAVVQDVVVAVAAAALVSVYAYALIYTWTQGDGGRRRKASMVLDDEPSIRLAGALGGLKFQDRVADSYVEDNVERISLAVESLEAYREAGALKAPQLRALVRAQMLRQLNGHGASFETAQA